MIKYSISEARRILQLSPNGLRDVIKRSKIKIEKAKMGKLFRYVVTDEDIETLKEYITDRMRRRSIHLYEMKKTGGKFKDQFGYIQVYAPWHPQSHSSGHVYEHTLVMEKKLKRYLLPAETLHHINGIRDDNRLSNLKLYENQAEHLKEGHKLFGKVVMSTEEDRELIGHILSLSENDKAAARRYFKIKPK